MHQRVEHLLRVVVLAERVLECGDEGVLAVDEVKAGLASDVVVGLEVAPGAATEWTARAVDMNTKAKDQMTAFGVALLLPYPILQRLDVVLPPVFSFAVRAKLHSF